MIEKIMSKLGMVVLWCIVTYQGTAMPRQWHCRATIWEMIGTAEVC